MNLLIVHNFYSQFGGEDETVNNQYTLFKEKGHNVLLYKKENRIIEGYSKLQKVKLAYEAYYSQQVKRELNTLVDRFKPDIAHVHNVYPLITPAAYDVLISRGIPIVQTLHNYRFICPNGLMYRNNQICEECLEKGRLLSCALHKCYHDSYFQSFWYSSIISKAKRKYFKKITSFIALNEFVKQKMIDAGYESEKTVVIPNAVREPVPTEPEYERKEDYFVYAGRLSREKGVQTLIKAFDRDRTIKLRIIGQGELESNINCYIEKNQMKNVELLGFVKGVEKEKLISRAKALIVPSEWYENFPTVILEAFSLGTPVIASDIGGIKYMVSHGKNGLLFEPGSCEELLKKVSAIDKSGSLVMELSENAYKSYSENYTAEKFYSRLIKLYENLLGRNI